MLRQHHIVGPEHRQVILHGLDVGLRKAFGEHAVAIRTHEGTVPLAVEQRVGPQGPQIVCLPPIDDEARPVFGGERDPLELSLSTTACSIVLI